MPPKWVAPDLDNLIRLYIDGVSIKTLGKQERVDRNVIARTLREAGVTLRSIKEATNLACADRTPEQRRAYTARAHATRRGRHNTLAHKMAIATKRELSGLPGSPAEQLLGVWLRQRGISVAHQVAIGPYNTDLAANPVAVELFGGGWHAGGHHATLTPERSRYILDEGWLLVVVWYDYGTPVGRLSEACANYIGSLHEEAGRNPSLRGQYRVIWGNGEDVTHLCPDLDHLSRIPTHRAAKRRRT